jgi:hypothetical protein
MCPIGFLMLGSPCKTRRAIRPPHADQPAAGGEPRCAPAPTNERSSRAPGPSWSATRSSWPPPHHLPRRRPGPNRRLGCPAAPAPASRRGADSGRRRAGHGRSGRPRQPRPSQPYGCLPTPRSRTSLRPDTAHAATHRHRTPTPDAGQRTPGRSDARTGHWTAVPWTGKPGHWSLAPDTGHRTLDTGHRTLAEDVDRLTKARPASGPPGPPRRATARWNAQPCSCGRRLRRSTAHTGSAVRPPSSAR